MSIIDRIKKFFKIGEHGFKAEPGVGIPYKEHRGQAYVATEWYRCPSCMRTINLYALNNGKCPYCNYNVTKKEGMEEWATSEDVKEYSRKERARKLAQRYIRPGDWQSRKLQEERKTEEIAKKIKEREARKATREERIYPAEGSWFPESIRKGKIVPGGSRRERIKKTVSELKPSGGWTEERIVCPYCHFGMKPDEEYLMTKEICPNCGKENPYIKDIRKYDVKSLRKGARQKVGEEVYAALMFIIAGIASLIVPSLLGFPISFIYLAVALMAVIPVYLMFPGESEILNSLAPGDQMGRKSWILVPKAFFKIFAFVLIIFQFSLINLMITLAISFIFYFFFLPIEFKNSEPYKMIESFFRMGLGLYIAVLFWFTFGTTSVGISLALMAAAFFFTFPVWSKEKSDSKWRMELEIISDKTKKTLGKFGYIDKAVFIILMVASIISGFMGSGLTGDITQIMFVLVWFMSLIIGLSSGPGGRPAVGALMIVIALITFSSTYTGVMGQAVFGYFWPQVQTFTEVVFEPLSEMWYQAQSGMSDAWLMLTNPQQYYLMQTQKQQATKSTITSGGTTKSIDLSRFDLSPSVAGILEPSEPVIGNMEIQNGGDFVSGEIVLNISAVWVDAVKEEEYTVGEITNLFCSNADSKTEGNPAQCSWTGDTYPKELRAVTFKLEEGDEWDDGVHNLYSSCMDNSGDSPTNCQCFLPGSCPVGNTTYEYSGTTVKVKTNLTYDYVVNVSMPVTIIGFDQYIKKLQAQEITLYDLTSEYTGGPVKATLFTQKQPARTDIPFLVVASIYNDGSGELKEITKFTITVYGGNLIENVTVIGSTFRESSPQTSPTPDGCPSGNITPTGENFIITCNNVWGTIKRGEFKRVSFYIYPSQNIVEEKTTQIVGWANYKYLKQKSLSLTVANAPPQ